MELVAFDCQFYYNLYPNLPQIPLYYTFKRLHDFIGYKITQPLIYGNKILLYPNLRLIPLYSKKIRAIVLEYGGIWRKVGYTFANFGTHSKKIGAIVLEYSLHLRGFSISEDSPSLRILHLRGLAISEGSLSPRPQGTLLGTNLYTYSKFWYTL